jgi:hypothetical protein
LYPENSCHNSVLQILSSHLLSKNINVQTVALFVLICDCLCKGRANSEGVREQGAKEEEVRGDRRKLRKEELHGFCCASSIRVIK